VNPFDTELLLWFNGFAGTLSGFDTAMQFLAGDYLLPMLSVLALVGLWFTGRSAAVRELRQRAVFIGMASLGLSNLPVVALNLIWDRPRPFVDLGDRITLLFYPATDPSFPANPTAVGLAVATSVWAVHRSLGYALFAGAILLSIARVYSGVFYPTDVIAGAVIGVVAVYGTRWLFAVMEPLPTLVIRLARAICLG